MISWRSLHERINELSEADIERLLDDELKDGARVPIFLFVFTPGVSVDIHRFSSWVFTVAMIWSRTSSASTRASSRALHAFPYWVAWTNARDSSYWSPVVSGSAMTSGHLCRRASGTGGETIVKLLEQAVRNTASDSSRLRICEILDPALKGCCPCLGFVELGLQAIDVLGVGRLGAGGRCHLGGILRRLACGILYLVAVGFVEVAPAKAEN